VDAASIEALQDDPGVSLLEQACAAYGHEDPFALGTRLRRTYPADLVATALTQAELRAKATVRFDPADAARMFFTVDGYEQASRTSVARRRAQTLRNRIGNAATVADLCCGVGGDTIELARAGLNVVAVDTDSVALAAATANVRALGLAERVELRHADVTTMPLAPFDAVFCDPARRSADGRSHRTFRVEDYRPAWSFVQTLLEGPAVVKAGPGIPHRLIPDGAHAEWISEGGTVLEATLWSADLSGADGGSAAGRSATVLPAKVSLTDDGSPVDVGEPGAYLYEPDGAVIRAGLVTTAADLVDGWLLDPTIAYIGSDTLRHILFTRAYRVRQVVPLDRRALRRRLAELDVGELVVKKRGVDLDPHELRRELRPSGNQALTLVATRVDGQVRALLVDPVTPP